MNELDISFIICDKEHLCMLIHTPGLFALKEILIEGYGIFNADIPNIGYHQLIKKALVERQQGDVDKLKFNKLFNLEHVPIKTRRLF